MHVTRRASVGTLAAKRHCYYGPHPERKTKYASLKGERGRTLVGGSAPEEAVPLGATDKLAFMYF